MTGDTSLVLDRDGERPAPPVPQDAATHGGLSARSAVIAVATLIVLAVAVAVFVGQARGPATGGRVATRPAPAFSLPDLRGTGPDVALPSRPAKPTVVNFFAAWCEPCKRELPALRAAAAANPHVTFLGVDHQDSRQDAVELLDAFDIPYRAGYDPRGEVAARYAVRGLPATAFIDTDGRIVEFHQGELSAEELEARISRLTSGDAADFEKSEGMSESASVPPPHESPAPKRGRA